MGNKKREILFLFGYLIIFAALFGISVYYYLNNLSLIDVGNYTLALNLGLMLLSVLSIIKTVWHIIDA